MAAQQSHSALKGVRRTAVIVIIVAVAVSAILGIVILLTGGWGDVQGRVLATTFAIAVFAVTALCHLVQVDRPLRAVGFAGIAASVLGLIPILIIIWGDVWAFDNDAYAWLMKAFALFAVLAGSLAQANLLLLLARRRQPAVRVVLVLALVMIAALAFMILLPILSDGRIPGWEDGDWYWRLFGVVAILDALCTIVLPVLGLVLKDARAGFVALTLQAPVELVARLDERAAAEGSTRAAVAEAALARGLPPDAR